MVAVGDKAGMVSTKSSDWLDDIVTEPGPSFSSPRTVNNFALGVLRTWLNSSRSRVVLLRTARAVP